MNRLLFSGLLAAGLGLAALTAHAQAEPYRFSLQGEKLDVPAGPWQVVRVLDLRADRSRLGAVRRGLDNQLTSADFSQPLAPELLQFVRAQLPAGAGARPVVMRVFALALAEDLRTSSEHAEAELVADFLEPQPDSTFRVVLAVGETTRRGGLDVTKFHPANVALVVQQALRALAAVPPAAPATPETLSRADVLAGRGGATARRFAIQAAGAPRRGFYRSAQEFRDNAPTEPGYPFTVTHVAHEGKRWAGTDEVQVSYLYTDPSHPARPVAPGSVWGLSDGTESLIAYRGHFYKLLPAADGRSYTFLGPPMFDAQAAGRLAAGSVAGGLVGAAIAGAVNSAQPFDPYEVHLATGRVVPAHEPGQPGAPGFEAGPDSAAVYVYRRPGAAKDQVVQLSANGQPTRELPARHYLALTWRDRRQALRLCAQLGTTPGACREWVPDFSQPTYLECVVPAGGGAPTLRPVSAKEGQFELRRLQLLAR